ncbi:uncharacterized protein [Oscarella lobularis]|uniref:uncharacterized protein isoform X2 n=1 Tax=Oscarella lobularis TaxID=121494 RepID=UPI0033135778
MTIVIPPGNLMFPPDDITNSSFKLTWFYQEGSEPIDKFMFHYNSSTSSSRGKEAGPRSFSLTFTGMRSCTTYRIYGMAVGTMGQVSQRSDVVPVKTRLTPLEDSQIWSDGDRVIVRYEGKSLPLCVMNNLTHHHHQAAKLCSLASKLPQKSSEGEAMSAFETRLTFTAESLSFRSLLQSCLHEEKFGCTGDGKLISLSGLCPKKAPTIAPDQEGPRSAIVALTVIAVVVVTVVIGIVLRRSLKTKRLERSRLSFRRTSSPHVYEEPDSPPLTTKKEEGALGLRLDLLWPTAAKLPSRQSLFASLDSKTPLSAGNLPKADAEEKDGFLVETKHRPAKTIRPLSKTVCARAKENVEEESTNNHSRTLQSLLGMIKLQQKKLSVVRQQIDKVAAKEFRELNKQRSSSELRLAESLAMPASPSFDISAAPRQVTSRYERQRSSQPNMASDGNTPNGLNNLERKLESEMKRLERMGTELGTFAAKQNQKTTRELTDVRLCVESAATTTLESASIASDGTGTGNASETEPGVSCVSGTHPHRPAWQHSFQSRESVTEEASRTRINQDTSVVASLYSSNESNAFDDDTRAPVEPTSENLHLYVNEQLVTCLQKGTVSSRIGVEGGSLALPFVGISLTIPPGAITSTASLDVRLSLFISDKTVNVGGATAHVGVIELLPHKTAFAKPVILKHELKRHYKPGLNCVKTLYSLFYGEGLDPLETYDFMGSLESSRRHFSYKGIMDVYLQDSYLQLFTKTFCRYCSVVKIGSFNVVMSFFVRPIGVYAGKQSWNIRIAASCSCPENLRKIQEDLEHNLKFSFVNRKRLCCQKLSFSDKQRLEFSLSEEDTANFTLLSKKHFSGEELLSVVENNDRLPNYLDKDCFIERSKTISSKPAVKIVYKYYAEDLLWDDVLVWLDNERSSVYRGSDSDNFSTISEFSQTRLSDGAQEAVSQDDTNDTFGSQTGLSLPASVQACDPSFSSFATAQQRVSGASRSTDTNSTDFVVSRSSALVSPTYTQDPIVIPEDLDIVSEVGASMWNKIGRALFNCPSDYVDNMVSNRRDAKDSEKLLVILENWVKKEGENARLKWLLRVCAEVNILGEVEKRIHKSSEV